MDASEIKRLRESLELTQQQMSEQLLVTVATISRWETGANKPSPLAIEQLRRLSAQTISILRREDNEKISNGQGTSVGG